MVVGNFLEQTAPIILEVAQTALKIFPTKTNDARMYEVARLQDVFQIAIQTQVKTVERQEGIVMIDLQQITQATKIPRLPQPQVTEIQHHLVQQGQLQVALLEVPLAHQEEDKSGVGCSVLKY
jgi:hypothetical protein